MSWEEESEALAAKEREDAEKANSAVTWKPEPGDSVVGTLIEGFIFQGDYDPCPVMVIEDSDGVVHKVFCGNKVLKESVEAKEPKPGMGVRVTYDGMREPTRPGGRAFKMFTLVVQESDTEYWHDVRRKFFTKQEEAMNSPGAGGYKPGEEPFDSTPVPY